MFELQGHRGARGWRPENTLPSFEAAIEASCHSVETDVQLTADGELVLTHDPTLDPRIVRCPGVDLSGRPPVIAWTLEQLRRCVADGNPDPVRFSDQRADVPKTVQAFAQARGIDPYVIPTLDELFDYVRGRGLPLLVDVEIKRVPARPDLCGSIERLAERVVAVIDSAGMPARVRSFDHRCVAAVRRLSARIETAILVDGIAPIAPGRMAREVGASVYCPRWDYVDEAVVEACHAEGVRIIPWTVNTADDMHRLIDWGVDGITTDDAARFHDTIPRR